MGKLTLTNTLVPGLEVRIAEVSAYHSKRIYTTIFSETFPVPGNEYIIDVSGIKGFGTFDIEEEEIGHYFPEMLKTPANCKYGNCTYHQGPDYTVWKAVEEHYIGESRYAFYLSMFGDEEEGKYRAAYWISAVFQRVFFTLL